MSILRNTCIALLAIVSFITAAEIPITAMGKQQDISGMIPVDANKAYDLILLAKGDMGTMTITVVQFDARKRRIGAYHVSANTKSLTQTVGPAIRGAKSFIVKDASGWTPVTGGRNILVFNAKADLSDLPNFAIDYYVKGLTQQADGTWKMEMSDKLRNSYPDSTFVRQHSDGANMAWRFKLPMTTPHGHHIAPADLGHGNLHWWKGTAFVQVQVCVDGATFASVVEWSLKQIEGIQKDNVSMSSRF